MSRDHALARFLGNAVGTARAMFRVLSYTRRKARRRLLVN